MVIQWVSMMRKNPNNKKNMNSKFNSLKNLPLRLNNQHNDESLMFDFFV